MASQISRARRRGAEESEVFAAIPEFERPIALARTSDGMVWIGDLDAQAIFTFDHTGQVVRVLNSMSGYDEP